MSAVIEVDGLRVRYAGADADSVRGVGFVLEPGEVLGVVGASGSGKTSLGLALLGLLPAGARASGSIRFEGRQLVGASERSLRPLRGSGLSTVVQNPSTALNPAFSVGAQLVALLRRHRGMSRAEATRVAVEWLQKVGIQDAEARMSAHPYELSGGMNQRVVLAMALALSPRLVVADEPTSALDVTVQAAILKLLRSLVAEGGSSMVLITHDLGVAAHMCGRILVMQDGAVVEEGTAEQILIAPRHEYTRRLLDALPERTPARTRGTSS